jgi:hypothetical protein
MQKLTVGRFGALIVKQGEKYGRDNVLTHKLPDPLVEFYDMKQRPEPQFVSRYYVKTLLAEGINGEGLCLDGGSPEWSINGEDMDTFRKWMTAFS